MAGEPILESGELRFYVRGVLAAFMEPTDPRWAVVCQSLDEYIDGVEAEARKQGAREERERLRAKGLDGYKMPREWSMPLDLIEHYRRWLLAEPPADETSEP